MGFKANLQEWVLSSEKEDLSAEFMRLLATAQQEGSSLADCWVTASRIDLSDDNSWYREWKKIGDCPNDPGNAALKGNRLTARVNCAVNYHQAPAFPYDQIDSNHQVAIEPMRERAGNYHTFRGDRWNDVWRSGQITRAKSGNH